MTEKLNIKIPKNTTKTQLREICARWEMLYNLQQDKLSTFKEYVKGIKNPHYPSSNEETEYYGFAEAISKVMEGLE